MSNFVFKNREQILMEINEFIHKGKKREEYHFEHIRLVADYAKLLNKRMSFHLSDKKITTIALAHDILKERSLNPKLGDSVVWEGHVIPQDLNRYVRGNIKTLEKFELEDYFNTDANLHALAAGIWLYNELGIKDPEILYPIMFHTCPIIAVYENLSTKIQRYTDITILSDKLSSNWLKINLLGSGAKVDLDLLVFGKNGNELNYSMGLFAARVISMGKSDGTQSKEATDYYFKKLHDINPLVSKSNIIKQLGGYHEWEKRKSQAFRIR